MRKMPRSRAWKNRAEPEDERMAKTETPYVPPPEMSDAVAYYGNVSGRDEDKIGRLQKTCLVLPNALP